MGIHLKKKRYKKFNLALKDADLAHRISLLNKYNKQQTNPQVALDQQADAKIKALLNNSENKNPDLNSHKATLRTFKVKYKIILRMKT